MANLQDLDEELGAWAALRFGLVRRSGHFVKIVLIIGGSVLAGVAHFVTEQHEPSAWHIAGIAASLIVGLGAIFLAFTEYNAPEELETARKAIAAARDRERELEPLAAGFEECDSALKRTIELYNAMQSMREVVRTSLLHKGPINLEATLDALLAASERSLKIAAGFQIDQHWTIIVYIAEQDEAEGRTMLRCFAHIRSTMCEKIHARKWPEGVGAGGVCYATGSEVIVPDIADEDRGNQYHAGTEARVHDSVRYRSLAAVPIQMTTGTRPWGVVVTTNDTPDHFRKSDPLGVHYIEAARAVATMVALTVATSYLPRAMPSPDSGTPAPGG